MFHIVSVPVKGSAKVFLIKIQIFGGSIHLKVLSKTTGAIFEKRKKKKFNIRVIFIYIFVLNRVDLIIFAKFKFFCKSPSLS